MKIFIHQSEKMAAIKKPKCNNVEKYNYVTSQRYRTKVARWHELWTCDQQVVGSYPTQGKSCITTLEKLFTPVCLCHKEVEPGTSRGAVMLCGWEGNHRPGGR